MKAKSLIFLLTMAAISFMASCSSPKVITHTEWRDHYHLDSIFLHEIDSVYITAKTVHDTVYLTEEKWKIRYRDRLQHDTVYVAVHDTTTIEKIVKIEKPLTWWQSTRIQIGNVAMVLLLCGAVWLIIRKKFKKKVFS